MFKPIAKRWVWGWWLDKPWKLKVIMEGNQEKPWQESGTVNQRTLMVETYSCAKKHPDGGSSEMTPYERKLVWKEGRRLALPVSVHQVDHDSRTHLNLWFFQPNLAYSFVILKAMDDFGVQTKIRDHILFTGFIIHVVCARCLTQSSGAVSLREWLKSENICFINGDDKVNSHEKG